MEPNPGLQVSLDVKGRVCLVLGGEDEAAEKTQRLLDAGARVTVIHPTLNDTLRRLAAAAKVIHRGRRYRAGDGEGAVLIINTLRDLDLARALFEQAKRERFLVCSTDQPEWSTLSMPAVVACGHFRLALSTSGVAPALASRLRQDFEEVFGPEFGEFVEWLRLVREEVQREEPEGERRRERLREAVREFKLRASLEYPSIWRMKQVASPIRHQG